MWPGLPFDTEVDQSAAASVQANSVFSTGFCLTLLHLPSRKPPWLDSAAPSTCKRPH